MPSPTASTAPTPVRAAPVRPVPARSALDHSSRDRSTLARTRLDWAIIASLLAMGALNLYVMADQFGATKAHASTVQSRSCGAPLA